MSLFTGLLVTGRFLNAVCVMHYGLIALLTATSPVALIPAPLKMRIKEICETHVRYGYRRVYYILRRDGWSINQKKIYRIYKELGMQLRNKSPKRRVKAKLREDRTAAVNSNDVWAMRCHGRRLLANAENGTLCTTSWQPVAKSVFLQSLIRYPAFRRSLIHASATMGRMWLPNWMRFAPRSGILKPYAWIMGASSSVEIWIYGLTRTTSR